MTKLKDFVGFFVVASLLVGAVFGGVAAWCLLCEYLIKDRQVAYVVSMLGVVIPCLIAGAWGFAGKDNDETK
jgi:hypothetical protein